MKRKSSLPKQFASLTREENGKNIVISETLAKLAELADMTVEETLEFFRRKTLDCDSYHYSEVSKTHFWDIDFTEEETALRMGEDGTIRINILEHLWPYFEPYCNLKIYNHFRDVIDVLDDTMDGMIYDVRSSKLAGVAQEVFLENYEESESIYLDADKVVSFVREKALQASTELEKEYIVSRLEENGKKNYMRSHEKGYDMKLLPFLREEIMLNCTFHEHLKHCFYVNKREYV